MTRVTPRAALGTWLALWAGLAGAQTIKPPQAMAWIDAATFSGPGMPAGNGNPLSMLGAMMGGKEGGNPFGQTQAQAAGRWVDVTLSSRLDPGLAEATQAVPGGFMPSALKLQAPRRAPQPTDSDSGVDHEVERPRGKLLLYWGCGHAIRAGQPKVLDMASASSAELATFFVSRRATQRGAHSAAGRPVWPNPADARAVPDAASLAGAHAFSGAGLPEGFRFQIPAAQDLMPALQLKQADQAGATELSWTAPPAARAVFAAGMGSGPGEAMVLWTSSELPDTGFGLLDYQTNTAIDGWLREKVLMASGSTRCTVPKGVFSGEGAMLRVIAYGSELNLAHPPRPADPKAAWEPVWAVKLRLKSVAHVMLGMPEMDSGASKVKAGDASAQDQAKPLDLLRSLLGR